MKRFLLSLAFIALLASSALGEQVQLNFAGSTTPNATTVNGSSQYVDLSGWSITSIHVETDAGVTGTVTFDCITNPSDTPASCGSDTLPFAGGVALSRTYVASPVIGSVRVTFSSVVGGQVRASLVRR